MSDASGADDIIDRNDGGDVNAAMLPLNPDNRVRGRPAHIARRATAKEVWEAGGTVEEAARAAGSTVRSVHRWRIEEGWEASGPNELASKPKRRPGANAAPPTVVAEQALIDREAETASAAVRAEVERGWPNHRA